MKQWKKLLPALLSLALLVSCGPKRPGTDTSVGDVSAPGTADPFVFTRDSLPRLDGSTSTAPMAQAMCAVLLGEGREQVADLVQFSRTTQSYRNLMAGAADLLLAAEPAPEVAQELKQEGEWLLTPFATDALVFVVNEDNPVDSLTTEQVRKIYTGQITNWKEVGGEDLDIIPFQRNSEAGSQTLMEKLVMDGLEMMDAPEAWVPDSMMGLLEAVREYDNSPSAIGYTVYYYANDMEMAKGLKVLTIDGVSPSAGRDTHGPTAACNSVARLDHGIASNGTLFNQKFHPSALSGRQGLENFVALIRSYFDQKGSHMQFNVVSRETLLDAQKYPEKYKHLVVRVAGYSAFFTTLSRSLQDDIINRTEQGM